MNDSLFIQRKTLDQNGMDTMYVEAVPMVGQSETVVSPGRVRKISLKWNDDSLQFVETIIYENSILKKDDHKSTYIWKLTGAKRMTLLRRDENLLTGEEFSMQGIYKKRTF